MVTQIKENLHFYLSLFLHLYSCSIIRHDDLCDLHSLTGRDKFKYDQIAGIWVAIFRSVLSRWVLHGYFFLTSPFLLGYEALD